MLIPLKVGLIGSNGDELPLHLDGDGAASDGLIEITDREQIFEFRDVPAPPTPSLLRGFSAPVRLTISLDPDQIEFLMMHDKDDFNRWQAAQTYATNLLTAAARDGGAEPSRVTGKEAARLAHALGSTAADASLAPAYRAEFLKLPSESDIARELARHVDTDAVLKARETLRATIAAADRCRSRRALRGDRAQGSLFARPRSHRRARAARRGTRPPRRDRGCVGHRPRRAPLPRGVEHDRRDRRARHPVPSRRPCPRRRARAFLHALAGRAARARQMVRGAGAGLARRFGRDRARGSSPTPNSR